MHYTTLDNAIQEATRHNPSVKKQVIIPFGRYSQLVQFAQATIPKGESVPSHKHKDMIEVFFIQSGEGIITINNQSMELKAETTVTVEVGEAHEIKNTGNEDLVMLFFAFRP